MGGGRFEGFDLERLGHGCHKDFYQGHGRNKRELTRESAREKIIWHAQKLPLVAQECGKIRKKRLYFRTVLIPIFSKALCGLSTHRGQPQSVHLRENFPSRTRLYYYLSLFPTIRHS